MAQVRRHTAELDGQDHHALGPFIAMPQPLLELIVISCTSTEDKRALRQTCQVFQQTLDSNMTCIKLRDCESKSRLCLSSLLGRMHMLRTARLEAMGDVCSFLKQLSLSLPCQLITLIVECRDINLKELDRLGGLKSLCLYSRTNTITGIECVSGLTHLDCYERIGSVAHLAPTLKHLAIEECEYVQSMNQLTNLEIMQVCGGVPASFFETHGQLPLRALCITPSACRDFFTSTQAWQLAPSTLTRLTLDGSCNDTWPTVLPASITHLQILGTTVGNATATAVATAIPGLVRLGIRYCNAIDRVLNKFTALQSISCVGGCVRLWQQVASEFPGLVKAAHNGVQITVVSSDDKLLDVFVDPFFTELAWASHV